MISLQAQIQQMGIGAAGANGEVPIMIFDHSVGDAVEVTNPKPFPKHEKNSRNIQCFQISSFTVSERTVFCFSFLGPVSKGAYLQT